MKDTELSAEIERLKSKFSGAEENKVEAMAAMIEQAAYETIYLKRLNEQAIVTGLVKIHPTNPQMQQTLPVSGEIAKHSATLTNILDKLCRNLCVELEEEDEGLAEYD